MATSADFADFVTEQLSGAGTITKRKMMGEYVVYCQEKVLALICDNKLFIKPTIAGSSYITEYNKHSKEFADNLSTGTSEGQTFRAHEDDADSYGPTMAPPYPGAKNFFLIEDELENRDFLTELIRVSYPELPKKEVVAQ